MRVDYSVDPTVDLAEAYRLVAGARGLIAVNLREQAMIMAEYNVITARGHRAVKRARDVRRQVRRLELERMARR